MSEITRRDLLELSAAAAVIRSIGAVARVSDKSPQPSASQPTIEVYTNTLSAAAGDNVTIHVSTTARHFNVQMARVGVEETIVWTRANLTGAFHPTPDDAWENGCRWPVSTSLAIPAAWKSGYYEIKVTTADPGTNADARAFVVVRASRPTAKILFVLATNTYGAYNDYGGASLYVQKKTGIPGDWGDDGEYQISFERPWPPGFLWKPDGWQVEEWLSSKGWGAFYAHVDKETGFPFWCRCAGFHNWERVMVRWLEQKGYEVDYAVSSDLELHPELLPRYRLMITAGHDEYWSWGMRDTVEQFIGEGGNVCFFSGDIAFWQVRYAHNGNRMICYKHDYQKDPYFDTDKTRMTATCWSSDFIHHPVSSMTGMDPMYAGNDTLHRSAARGYLVYRPEHWIFNGTGLVFGDVLGHNSAIVQYETDGCPIRFESGLPYPASDFECPSSLEILGMVPVRSAWSSQTADQWTKSLRVTAGNTRPEAIERLTHVHAVMSTFTKKGTVFCAGTCDWTSGLTGKDPAVERITKNLLDRLSV